ncbi:MAG: asparagine synthase (glutamine-hydrolyzing) [Flavobacteriales bacterium]|nr:asparagine synthase (glutamine-hydrolyzing) [Flavobacteriales bacterium]
MCGIAGIVGFEGLPANSREELQRMCDALKHRGPDNEGIYLNNFAAFGQRRLSIIDLSEQANQPMLCNKGEVLLNFNGEIYNHAELRKELESKYEFRTDHSDTEALLYAYKEWGMGCIEKLTGMFAISIFDSRNQSLYLVRDRIGQKPLYYTHRSGRFYFSSEIQAFFEAGVCTRSIRADSVYHYLTMLTVPAPDTFFEGIHKLEAGHYLEISRAGMRKHAYWDISKFLNKSSRISEEEAIEKTEFLLERSMRYRNISDAPVALAVSGGLDSSLNVYYSSKINPDIRAINLDFEGEAEFNESSIARRFCEEIGIPFSGNLVSKALFSETITRYLSIQKDQPLGDPNFVLMYLISGICRKEGAKVLLVGEGGDEIGGYPKYLQFDKERKRLERLPGFVNRLFQNSGSYAVNKYDLFESGGIISHAHVHGFTEAQKRRLWKGPETNSYGILKKYMNEISTDTSDRYLRAVLNLEYKLRLPELILARIDYPSMAASIEARSPFADHKLIEFSAGLPFDLKMKNGSAKYLLKKVARDKLPNYVLDHPKVGFGKMLNGFFSGEFPGWFREEVLQSESPVSHYLDKAELERFYNYSERTGRMRFQIWVLYALHKWLISAS